ncbi:MAG: UUP1 family membrane protein [Nitrosomonadales bacterium]|nr:UUP1 family membrane protein [Nitrosomonadales bacterium]
MTSNNSGGIRRNVYLLVLAIMVLLPVSVAAYKLYVLDYPLAGLIPTTSYKVEVSMQVDGHGEDISIHTYLPKTDSRQTIDNELNSSGIFTSELKSDPLNREVFWKAENVRGQQGVLYTYTVHSRHVQFNIPSDLPIPDSYPAVLAPYLADEPGLQRDDPQIAAALRKIVPAEKPTILDALTRIHRHLQDNLANRNFSGYTDALTALKLGEASCNGKSRLFVSMARKLNIPARLVGGLIMQQGSKRTTHQWVEIYVNGYWVPFDTINDHFAEIPAHYLTLYYGDLALFKHTSNVNFQYFFNVTKQLVQQRDVQNALSQSMLNVTNFYAFFERIGIPQNLLKILLMLPLGALVTVVFRNVIGLETFGTFLPALIASAARDTGLMWGIAGFLMIILVSALVRRALDWLQLLHSPKMAIMLTTVVIVMMAITVGGVQLGLFELAHMTLFPIAILAITAERVALMEAEQGAMKVANITFMTLIVIAACYAVMESLFMQSLILAFPELLLVVIALNLWLGKWIGIRVLEFVRFRRLIMSPQEAAGRT